MPYLYHRLPAVLVLILTFLDAIFTIQIGYEASPLLKDLFEYSPLLLFVVKGMTIPLIYAVAARPEPLARNSLWVAVGWYGSVVTLQIAALALVG